MQSLAKQEEYDDEDDWNPSKAAGVCLMLLANCTCNDIVQHVLPFVQVSEAKKPDAKEHLLASATRSNDAIQLLIFAFRRKARESSIFLLLLLFLLG